MDIAITLIEVGNSEVPNIGTIYSETSNETKIRELVTESIEAHFDAEIRSFKIKGDLNLIDVRNGPPLDLFVRFKDEEYTHKIEVQQTWIYK